MIIEICANSYQSAVNAQKAGAHRIELCTELAVGGITPSYGLIKQVVKALKIPVFVLIRPRSGNFTYSEEEFEIMKQDFILCKKLGCNGIVSGVLNADNTIDMKRTEALIKLSKPLPFTFHRAFDWVPNPTEALEQLISLGAHRILTSGQELSATQGLNTLIKLKMKANNRILILPGGSVNSENAIQFKNAKFKEIHCSASIIKRVNEAPRIPMNSQKFFDERIIAHSDVSKIKDIIKSVKT